MSKALMMVRPSNRSGWLHTLRSCIRTLMTPRKLPEDSVSCTSVAAMYSSYRVRWRLLRRQCMTCSCLPGNCFSTSDFRRRSKKGRSTPCRRSTSCLLNASEPSTMPVRGLQNQSRNWEWLANTSGMRKCIRLHSSIRSFCRGVPVMSRRRLELKRSSVCQRWLFQFLIMWASSRMRYRHFLRRNILASERTKVYEVMQTWNALGLDHPSLFFARSLVLP
mmetsp:Transcript_6011/g.16007  ORF Transcript_6011/g.16007 Transcript_6011/m.16007 type:complete len:220 (-) Transcript_6011:652-1311(-)